MDNQGHKARKRFGQNFLHDPHIIARIVALINPLPGQKVVEIGPGLGALTRPLLSKAEHLTVVELDRDLVERLVTEFPAPSPLRIISGDALKQDFSAIREDGPPLRIVGNLPYNISTPLLFHLLSYKADIADMHFMLQKEVVDRLASPPGTKSYGRLSVIAQYHCTVSSLLNVPPGAFNPAPKVDSAIVRLIPALPTLQANCLKTLENVVSSAFQQRRKTLRNGLKYWSDQLDNYTDIDLSRRAETLSVDEFVQLANHISLTAPE